MSPAFVALGDSITVGLGDPMPDRTNRGWAALLAEGSVRRASSRSTIWPSPGR